MTVRKQLSFAALFGVVLGLAGCGYSPGSRALSGGAIGAGTGAIVGAVAGGSPATGALIGGAVGAVGGAVTSPNTVNLGRPIVGR
ncbi:MAG: YMGG-like glycine zipper-containing protein [Acetobacteraceae bacterium]